MPVDRVSVLMPQQKAAASTPIEDGTFHCLPSTAAELSRIHFVPSSEKNKNVFSL